MLLPPPPQPEITTRVTTWPGLARFPTSTRETKTPSTGKFLKPEKNQNKKNETKQNKVIISESENNQASYNWK